MPSAGLPIDVSWWDAVSTFGSAQAHLPYLAAVLLALMVLSSLGNSSKNAVMLNPKSVWELTSTRAKKEYIAGALQMMGNWFNANPNPHNPAQMIADTGVVTVLPSHMADEIRNDDRLSFSRWTLQAFHRNLPGFDGFREGGSDSGIIKAVIVKDLTKHLNKVTEPLAAETAMVIPELLSDNEEWHSIALKDTIVKIIARVSSRVFLGDLLCRNEEWLEVTRDYTLYSFTAAEELRLWPAPLLPIVHWFLPQCRKLRALLKVIDDAIEWFEKEANGQDYDPVSAQLILSVAAIHTTTDLTCQTLTQLAQNPEILAPLRKELVDVLQEHGWKKTSLYNMKLLDSVVKESQRLKPTGIATMRRLALDEVKLSDDTVIPKNSQICVSSLKLWDSEVYENPDKFDGYRFYKMREQAEGQTKAQLVTTAPEYLAWGHGKHACPGRFFAANEVKIVLIYLLLRYDWRIADGQTPQFRRNGFSLNLDQHLRMMIRRRQEEMVI
ncbi:cytochrome P450, putative [Talaromyces stipitatus ATCC 10500]|uniref:Cytochrome P450, putative n=1 Tax=Talaromyces stipitatus (strain ATCC 10500 / CBS 375.48 / QM 6759 / NRRL 1006) TaxID=441959 RepID=B8MHT5_TALSN|nr:cytochrome P450, putative [Talaromyces stipitatus ATCC 10500]EED16415.1 cytochrome P450, putative [Talaromyces stipitatus ATCC 10500]